MGTTNVKTAKRKVRASDIISEEKDLWIADPVNANLAFLGRELIRGLANIGFSEGIDPNDGVKAKDYLAEKVSMNPELASSNVKKAFEIGFDVATFLYQKNKDGVANINNKDAVQKFEKSAAKAQELSSAGGTQEKGYLFDAMCVGVAFAVNKFNKKNYLPIEQKIDFVAKLCRNPKLDTDSLESIFAGFSGAYAYKLEQKAKVLEIFDSEVRGQKLVSSSDVARAVAAYSVKKSKP